MCVTTDALRGSMRRHSSLISHIAYAGPAQPSPQSFASPKGSHRCGGSKHGQFSVGGNIQGKPASMLPSQLVWWHHRPTTCMNDLKCGRIYAKFQSQLTKPFITKG